MVNNPSIYRVLYMPSGCLGFLPSTGFRIVHPDLMDVFFFFRTSCKDTGLTSRKTPVCLPIQGGLISHDIRIYTHVVNLKSVD